MTINVSEKMIVTLQEACRAQLANLRYREESLGRNKPRLRRLLVALIADTQEAFDMLQEMGGR